MGAEQLRILLVEDDPLVRRSVEMLLTHLGHSVEAAESGTDALAKMERTEFSLVLADLHMPGMKGDELAREIRRLRPKVPIVLITGSGSRPPSPEFVRVLNKPFAIDELRDVLRLCIDANADSPAARLTVIDLGDAFQIEAFGFSSQVEKVRLPKGQVVNEVAGLLNTQLSEKRPVAVQAPDWIRQELRQRGFEV
ncbi:MAG: response regulator [Verrucomicrobiota bacterium]